MGLRAVSSFLARHARIALDTSVFIYQLETHPRYVSVTDPIFAWVQQRGHVAVTSTITMVELPVRPYRDNDERRVNACYSLLSTYPNLRWIAPELEVADIAARMRAMHRLRVPDALQAASAVQAQATAMITNDPIFKRIDAFETLVLDQLL